MFRQYSQEYFEILGANSVPLPLTLPKILRALAMDRNGPSVFCWEINSMGRIYIIWSYGDRYVTVSLSTDHYLTPDKPQNCQAV
jgi:hypothetical protein